MKSKSEMDDHGAEDGGGMKGDGPFRMEEGGEGVDVGGEEVGVGGADLQGGRGEGGDVVEVQESAGVVAVEDLQETAAMLGEERAGFEVDDGGEVREHLLQLVALAEE